MKIKAQTELLEEYEDRKAEFANYGDFLDAKLNESPKMKNFWDSITTKANKASA